MMMIQEGFLTMKRKALEPRSRIPQPSRLSRRAGTLFEPRGCDVYASTSILHRALHNYQTLFHTCRRVAAVTVAGHTTGLRERARRPPGFRTCRGTWLQSPAAISPRSSLQGAPRVALSMGNAWRICAQSARSKSLPLSPLAMPRSPCNGMSSPQSTLQ